MTLVTRDAATGLRHSGIRHPNGQPPAPFGCRWCGTDQHGHGRTWVASVGMHAWERPTNAQILARMQGRRHARLNAAQPSYHALTRYSGSAGNPDDEGYALCADCNTDACPQYQRIQTRLARSWTSLAFEPTESADDNPDYDDTGCQCPPSDNQYLLEIDEGQAVLIHATCGKPPSYKWGDFQDLIVMNPIPVTVEWESDCTGWHYETSCDCDSWVNVTASSVPEDVRAQALELTRKHVQARQDGAQR